MSVVRSIGFFSLGLKPAEVAVFASESALRRGLSGSINLELSVCPPPQLHGSCTWFLCD